MNSGKLVFYGLLCFATIFQFHAAAQNFITRNGTKLHLNGQEIRLRGFAFGNLVWGDYNAPFNKHHTEEDFTGLKKLGMNAVRFYMNYRTFEDDSKPFTYKQEGWNWIDSNIVWAKKNNIYLILNMHVPQGGYQSQCGGNDLWMDQENQKRLAGLWNAIAERYKNEPQIAGFDLLNEPIPNESVSQWSSLAQRLIDTIRVSDKNHLIITERAIALNCDYSYNDGKFNYPEISEENLMYTVHLYDPFEFTHQNLDWAGTGDGGSYPDENAFTTPYDLTYATGNYSNPTIPAGNSDWTFFEGTPEYISNDALILGRVVFITSRLQEGKAYFDDIVLSEYDENENFVREIFRQNLNSGTYWFWSEKGDGKYEISSVGHNDDFSIVASGTSGNGTVTLPFASFKVKKGHIYKVSGWMKGENLPGGANAMITTEFYKSLSGQPIMTRNFEFIRNKIVDYSSYVTSLGYPVYFGEFGTARNTFLNNKGGERWVADALKVFDSLGFHWTYHSYKESSFGYYDGWDEPIDRNTVNNLLKETFEAYFNRTLAVKEFTPSTEIKIYPNPTADKFHIQNTLGKSVKGQITDLSGKIIWTGELGTAAESLIETDFTPGIYMLNIYRDGERFCYKIIKTTP
jgi:endoglucanase